MSLVPCGIVASRVSAEMGGKRPITACMHPIRPSVFLVCGQTVEEYDTRDGSSVARLVSDLTDPILRMEVSCSDKGHTFVLLISASNEMRVWDWESKSPVASVVLGGVRSKAAYTTALAATVNHNRCILFYSRAGSPYVEALHIQRQTEKPGNAALIALLEPKVVRNRSAAVTAITTHTKLKLIAAATNEGIVTVFECPFLSDPVASQDTTDTAGPATTEGEDDDFVNKQLSKTVSKRTESIPVDVHAARVVMAAAVSPDYERYGSRIRKTAASGTQAQSSPFGAESVDSVSALAFHPHLPLLAAADGTGRIVVWRIGLTDGNHGTVCSRDGCVPRALDDSVRAVSSLIFHPTLPRLYSLAYSPTAPTLAPLIQAWCTGHSTLPPLPSPLSPALGALLHTAMADPLAALNAAITSPPALLCDTSSRTTFGVWAGGRVVCCHEIVAAASVVGADLDDDFAFREEPLAAVSAKTTRIRLVPHHATGVAYGVPVVDTIQAPRAWFADNLEADGCDILLHPDDQNSSSGQEKQADSTFGESLAEFAAKLVGSGGATAKAESKSAAADEDLLACGLPAKNTSNNKDVRPALPIDCALFIQTAVEAATNPYRLAMQHSLMVSPLGAPLSKDGIDSTTTAAEAIADAAKRLDPAWMQRTKRVCWLPTYGPNGPLLPVSMQRSPSGKFVLIRFAYVTEVTPASITSETAVLSKPQLKSTPAGSNMSAAHPTEPLLYVIVGPLTASADNPLAKSSDINLVDFDCVHSGCPVSGLATAVDVTILHGDRLLVVRRPNTANTTTENAGKTEYIVSVEPLEIDITDVSGASKSASGVDKPVSAASQARKAIAMTPLKFAVHDPVYRLYPTPFRSLAPLPTATSSDIAESKRELSVFQLDEDVSDASLAHLDDEAIDPSKATDTTVDGDVLMYVTRFRPFDEIDADEVLDRKVLYDDERHVLRYSNNAFGPYSLTNCHGYALTHAYDPLIGAKGPAKPIGGVESTTAASGRDHDPFAVPTISPASTARANMFAGQMSAHEQWTEHKTACAVCPFDTRPALVLSPGEKVIRVTFTASDTAPGDAGMHDTSKQSSTSTTTTDAKPALLGPPASKLKAPAGSAVAPPKRLIVRPRVTLLDALASGSHLVAVFTTHRLLLCNVALEILAALPCLPPVTTTTSNGLAFGMPAANTAVTQSPVAADALECGYYGMWKAPAALRAPDGHDERASPKNTLLEKFTLGGGYRATAANNHNSSSSSGSSVRMQGPGATSAPAFMPAGFGVPVSGLSAVDSSAMFQGGVVVNTVATAGAVGARLIAAPPASRLADTVPCEDVADEVMLQFPWRTSVVSHVWCGPALIFTSVSGDVWYMTPAGRVFRLCALEASVKNACIVSVLPDRLIFACTSSTGRVQLRYRHISLLECLAVCCIDLCKVRPTINDAAHAKPANSIVSSVFHVLPHPVIQPLLQYLSASVTVYNRSPDGTPKHKTQPVEVLTYVGQAALRVASFAATARDYNFIKSLLARYLHRAKTEGVRNTVSRVLVAVLQEAGLLDAAYAAAKYALAATREQESKQDEDAGGDTRQKAVLFNSSTAQIPATWLADIAMARRRADQAIEALIPSVKQAISTQTDAEDQHVKLPSPFSVTAAHLRKLGYILMLQNEVRGALLCFDAAGDYTSASLLTTLAAINATLKGDTSSRALQTHEIDGAYASLASITASRNPAVALFASLRRALTAWDSETLRKAGRMDEDEEDYDDGNNATPPSMPQLLEQFALHASYAALSLSRTTRGDDLMPFDYTLGKYAPGQATSRLQQAWHPLSGSPFRALLAAADANSLRNAFGQPEKTPASGILVHRPSLASLYSATVLSGGTFLFDEKRVAHIKATHAPLLIDSVQKAVGTALPQSRRSGAADRSEDREGEADDVAEDLSLEAMLGGLGPSAAEDVDPGMAAVLASRGKRRLRPLARGQEDSVIGYWRFEKSDEEQAAEKQRLAELQKAGKSVAAGVWGVALGSSSKEDVSIWPLPLPDLSKQQRPLYVFDAPCTLARVRGGAEVSSLFPTSEGITPRGDNEVAPFVRVGVTNTYDSPCEAGDLSKVREPRVLVVGVNTVREISMPSETAIISAKPANASMLAKVSAGALAQKGGPGIPSVPVTNDLRLLSQLVAWAAVIPIPRFSYVDIGIRPFDPQNAAVTLEAWIKPGYPFSSALPAEELDAEDVDEDGNVVAKARTNSCLRLQRELIVFGRTERVPKVAAPAPLSSASEVTLQYQWNVQVTQDGVISFVAFPNTENSKTVSSTAGSVLLGQWNHVAVVLDASAAAKEAANRIRVVGAAHEQQIAKLCGSTPAGSGSILPQAAQTLLSYEGVLPEANVRIFVDGNQVAEGKVSTTMPQPLLDVPPPVAGGPPVPNTPSAALRTAIDGTTDHLLIAPDFVGRVSEVRLWSKKRSADELADAKDFHLDLAESKKTKMQVVIKPATLPSAGPKRDAAFAAPSSVVALPSPAAPAAALKKPTLAGPSSNPGIRRRIPGSTSTSLPSVAEHDATPAAVDAGLQDFEPTFASSSSTTAKSESAPAEKSTASEFDDGLGFGADSSVSTPAVPAPSAAEDDSPAPKPLGMMKLGGGGLGKPPPGVPSKKAALLRAAATGSTT